MSDNISMIFRRMGLQAIRAFLSYGTEEYGPDDDRSFSARLKNGSDPIYKRLDAAYPDGREKDEAAADLSQALSAYEAVYLELGMKAGARLIYQLLASDDP